ncbi:MAG: hypothetical protein KDB61_02865 [Planctomycetes bacterium]|nr:hypothetical protein [Planctomycetota bacterium]
MIFPVRILIVRVALWLGVAVCLSFSAEAAESAGRIISIAHQIASQKKRVEGMEAQAVELSRKQAQMQQEYFEEDFRLTLERDKQLADLLAEKEQTLEDLRNGLFCSKCDRSATEIEKTLKISFDQHKDDVDSEGVPMSPEKIQKKMEDYDKKIAAVERRFAGRLKRLRETYEKGYAALSGRIVDLRVRIHMIRLRAESALRDKLRKAIREYTVKNEESDAHWQKHWMERKASQQVKTAMDELQAKPAIERARAALTVRIARGDTEEADRLEERLNELLQMRRQTREDNRWRGQDLERQYEETLKARARSRNEEEQRILDALQEAGVGGYSPMGLRLDGRWYVPPSASLHRAQQETAQAIQRIREQYADAVWESRRDIAGLSSLQYGAMRMGERSVEWLMHRPEVVRNNLQRIRNGYQRLRGYAREDGVPAVFNNALMQGVTQGASTITPSNVAPWVALDLGILYTRRWSVGEMRDILRQSKGGTLSEYEIDAVLREIDPDMGVHNWYLPHHPGLKKYLENVYSLSDDMRKELDSMLNP